MTLWAASRLKGLRSSTILGGQGTFSTKIEAKRARERACERLGDVRARDLTLYGFWERWTTDPRFARPKESTNIHRDQERALDRVTAAYERTASHSQMRLLV
jgi:hypothetical protein